MKLKKLLFLFLTAITIILYCISCQKIYSPSLVKDAELIEKAKNWFQNYKQVTKFDTVFNNIEYQWSKSKTFTYPNGYKIVVLPIKEVDQSFKYEGVRLLYLHPWKNGNGFYTTVFEFIPDFYELKHKKVTLNDFTGYVNSWSLKKGFQYGIYLKNAVILNTAKLVVENNNILNPITNAVSYVVIPSPGNGQLYSVQLFINNLQTASINNLMYGGSTGGSNPCEVTGPGSCTEVPWELMDESYLHSLFYDTDGYLHQRKQELNEILINEPLALEPCDSLNIMPLDPDSGFGKMWQKIAQHQLAQPLKNRIDSINSLFTSGAYNPPMPMYQQTLNAASGVVVNCDFFPVKINQLPTGFTAKSLLEYFRLHMNDFVGSVNSFLPYQYSPGPFGPSIYDTGRFNASYQNSTGALVHIGILGNDGTVMQSNYSNRNSPPYNHESHQFMYTTLHSPLDNSHPVAGNRAWGIYNSISNPGEYTFYTMGVDRTWDWMDGILNSPNNPLGTMIFNGADALWRTMQANFIAFINSLPGGQAVPFNSPSVIARPKWNDVKEYLQGDIDWITLKQRLGC